MHPDGKQHAEFPGTFEHGHDEGVHHAERYQNHDDPVEESGADAINGDGLLQVRKYFVPRTYRQAQIPGWPPSQRGCNSCRGGIHGAQVVAAHDQRMYLVSQPERVLHGDQRRPDHRAIQLALPGAEQTHDLDGHGGNPAFRSRPQDNDLVAHADPEIARQPLTHQTVIAAENAATFDDSLLEADDPGFR